MGRLAGWLLEDGIDQMLRDDTNDRMSSFSSSASVPTAFGRCNSIKEKEN